jgi:hypothetical protein
MNGKLERKLNQAAASQVPEVDLWDDIRRQVGEIEKNDNRLAGRSWKFALGVAVIALLALASSPEVQAFAQGIIQQIGSIKFIPQTPDFLVDERAQDVNPAVETDVMEQSSEKPLTEMSDLDQEASEKYGLIFSDGLTEAQKAEILAELANRPDTIQEAEFLMGDHVLQPTDLPPGYSFSRLEAYESDYGVLTTYTHFYKYDQNGDYQSSITLSQVSWPDDAPEQFGTWPVGEEAVISDSTVRGLPAKYVQEADISIVPHDILSWEEEGFDFSILVESGELSLEELQEFAAGLK